MLIEGKRIVVTGAGSGIGEALCRRFASAALGIVAADINPKHVQAVVDSINSSSPKAKVVPVTCDVCNMAQVKEMFERAKQEFGGIDIVCLNAGIQEVSPYSFFTQRKEQWMKVLQVNLISIVETVQYLHNEIFAPTAEQATEKRNIIVTASIAGTVPEFESPVYAASKAGVVNFVKSLTWMESSAQVRINAICPHMVATRMLTDFAGDQGVELTRQTTGGNPLTPAQVVQAVVELLYNDECNGEALRIIIGKGYQYWPNRNKPMLHPNSKL